MAEKKREIRTFECTLSVREREGAEKGESRTITGTAIVFNNESQVLDGWGTRFREIILPEAASMDFLMTQDIKMNMLHQRELTVARWNKGEGSLRLSVDDKGVNFEFEAPKCDIGDRCLEMVRRGDYSGCSFEFWEKNYEEVVERNEDGTTDLTIIHHEFEAIGALTIGMDPAYTQTSVNARELMQREDEEEEKTEEPEEEKTEEPTEEKVEEPEEEPAEEPSEENDKDTEDDEKEQKEREIAAVMHARKMKVSLMDIDTYV